MEDLYGTYMSAPEKAAGKLPVIKLTGTKPVKTKHGTNYDPSFEIVAWVDRPAVLDGGQEEPVPIQTAPTPLRPAAPPAVDLDFG